MIQGSAVQWWGRAALFLSVVALSGTVQGTAAMAAEEEEIDAVWSTSDGRRMEIFYTHRQHGAWREPVQVTDDYFDNNYPVIDRDSTGRRWLFWSAYDNGRMEVRYTTGTGETWEPSAALPTDMDTNIAPSAVIDAQDQVWVVWSANDGRSDALFYARHAEHAWTEPMVLHEDNGTLDVLPEIELDGDGTPRVNWRSLQDGTYRRVTSSWTGDGWSPAEPVEEKGAAAAQGDDEEQVELPPFLSRGGLVFIRVY